LIGRRWHSTVVHVQSFRTADSDTDHYLVVAKFRERLAVGKRTKHRFHMERSSLKKLNEVEGKEKFHVEISTRFAPLGNSEVDINRACETVRKNIKISVKGCLGYF
jgi:hypothetical protein